MRTRSLKKKLYTYNFILASVICLMLGGASYVISSNIEVKKTEEQTQQLLSQTNKSMEFVITNFEKISDMLFSNQIILGLISKEGEPSLADVNTMNQVLEDYSVNTKIDSILIINNEGAAYTYGPVRRIDFEEAKNRSWYQRVHELHGRQLWLVTRNNEFNDRSDRMMLTNIREITDTTDGRVLGIQIINVSSMVLTSTFQDLQMEQGAELFIIDEKGTIVADKNTERIGQSVVGKSYYSQLKKTSHFFTSLEGQRQLVINEIVPKINSTILMTIPYNALTRDQNGILWLTIYVIVGSLVLSFILVTLISKQLFKPIHQLGSYMKIVESGDLSVRASMPNEEELIIVYNRFNSMITRVEQLTEDLSTAFKVQREAEMKALQAQINPHFLYNTLESVNSLAKIHQIQDISNLVLSLSQLLRLSIDQASETISIREELLHLQSYLQIQNIRYRDKFIVTSRVDESVLEYKMIKLILQPLVENCIFHGVEQLEKTGRIEVLIEEEGETVRFRICDNGKGMSKEKLIEINESLHVNHSPLNKRGSYGVKNVHDRLTLFYGGLSKLQYESELDHGTTVTFVIPKQK
jgi:two-component system sensor histidine kinase YesM